MRIPSPAAMAGCTCLVARATPVSNFSHHEFVDPSCMPPLLYCFLSLVWLHACCIERWCSLTAALLADVWTLRGLASKGSLSVAWVQLELQGQAPTARKGAAIAGVALPTYLCHGITTSACSQRALSVGSAELAFCCELSVKHVSADSPEKGLLKSA